MDEASYALTRDSIPLHHRFYVWRARTVGFTAACAVIVQQGAQLNAGSPLLAGMAAEFVSPALARAMETFLAAALDADAREVVYMGGDVPGELHAPWRALLGLPVCASRPPRRRPDGGVDGGVRG